MTISYILFRKYKSENEKRAQLKDAKLKLAFQEQQILTLQIQEEEKT